MGARSRVLIVDDDKVITSALRRLLSSEHEVTVTNDPAEAIALVRAGQRYDAILCDLIMPVMNGVQLHRELAAVSPEQASATILMTGGAIPSDAARLLASGIPSLPKPFDVEQLRRLLKQLRSDVPGSTR